MSNDRTNCIRRMTFMQRYSVFLSQHPFVIVVSAFVGNLVILLIILCTDNIPAFDDPQAGFEPRGTLINQRTQAWKALFQQTEADSSVTSFIPELVRDKDEESEDYDGPQRLQSPASYLRSPHVQMEHVKIARDDKGSWPISRNIFCSDPVRNFARVIFRREDGDSMLDFGALRDVCLIDRKIRRLPTFKKMAERNDRKMCLSWTLPNYVAAFHNKSTCAHITEEDVLSLQRASSFCLPFFLEGRLTEDCWVGERNNCPNTPDVCCRENLFHHIFTFISDRESLGSNYTSSKYTLALLPVWSSLHALPLYKEMRAQNLSTPNVKLLAIDMGLKDGLFETYFVEDALFMVIAAVMMIVILWIYTVSLFVTVMNVMAIFSSLIVAYFIYTFVLKIRFFPFMNLLACVIMISIGSDALIIYARLWRLAKTEKNDGKFEKVIQATVCHAAKAIFLASATASASLFADCASPIVAIRCFGIFAGLTILIHSLFAVTWIPAFFVVSDKWSLSSSICDFLFYKHPRDNKPALCRFFQHAQLCHSSLCDCFDCFRVAFEKILPCIVIRFKWVWVSIFCLLTVCSCFAIFVYPKLRLASSQNFQLWSSSHPWEQYQALKENFAFERLSQRARPPMPLRFVWGILPSNDSDLFDPEVIPSVRQDPSMDISSSSSQLWMLNFCYELEAQPFCQNCSDTMTSGKCFMKFFRAWTEIQPDCQGPSVCCNSASFPFNDTVFELCSRKFLKTVGQFAPASSTKLFGPTYSLKNSVRSFVVDIDSAFPYTHSYAETKQFVDSVETWFQAMLQSAPEGLSRGWFYSRLEFFDLQDSLLNGTLTSVLISLAVALVVLFLTTLNICVSVISIVNVIGIMTATTAILVLLDWELGVFESATIGLATGLSFDFTLHFAVSFCAAKKMGDRELQTNHAIAEMTSPVSMSALTSLVVGVLMLPSETLIYKQIGVFMIVVIGVSFFYSTFLFTALLAAIGPNGTFMQFSYPSCRNKLCCRPDPSKLVEKSMNSSMEFDSALTTGSLDRERQYQYRKGTSVKLKTMTSGYGEKLETVAEVVGEEDDSVGELGSVSTSREPSRGASLIRKNTKNFFSWDFLTQKLPLTRHFSVANSSVIYIDADVRSVTSTEINPDIPAIVPNVNKDAPEVWVRRAD
ncbi:hypothetical protein RvY_05020 [Ramazzottius varieornatus]|uniref:SSD domain-containing protein n=1 Tax=Ramazzottius varieornatus TaxID=947166 RepID=A0A1D1UWQ2_RAMVA|nr:hypothetical protein RvY_05020 [Ramazzottius varieornatus]